MYENLQWLKQGSWSNGCCVLICCYCCGPLLKPKCIYFYTGFLLFSRCLKNQEDVRICLWKSKTKDTGILSLKSECRATRGVRRWTVVQGKSPAGERTLATRSAPTMTRGLPGTLRTLHTPSSHLRG